MHIVTGGAGFIGSNLVHELNRQGIIDILVVDNFADSRKLFNLHGARFVDYMDKREFRRALEEKALRLSKVSAIYHQGACSNTLVDDGVYMMDNNFTTSKVLLHYALEQGAPFVYASTAAVYGLSGPGHFTPTLKNEKPLNIYGFSKLAFDHYVRSLLGKETIKSTVVGLRYFNVYGPREQHKGRMASVIHHFTKQILETGRVRLFEGSGGYGNGEQRRDFVYVRDLARLNLFFAQTSALERGTAGEERIYQGVVNAGSGQARTFNEVARALMSVHGPAQIEYIPFPADLDTRYQHFTEADLTGLRALGYDQPMTQLKDGIQETFAAMAEMAV
ncbi:ADP-glyceromanno-heptose 6-epimerase [Silvibacterium dinghuense]|uniref:ADP-L-glycero-D-manno-heptose-6-epimerase n=1 Tax=Silvibacterium dinghuense TaxID=1560006 RepID=A0A4Q1S7S5_9BACT|nr:ADP-glyceromanno-heptose 6-epimerase [Silvibacterium dinghuense]RXS93044.1 ADP-glyceromanno-heptose 6-epimerase [Silvibacterium dinghuense]GGG89902.1 ADP-L-glycero-D-manno-heptose-6-epimerase [Silvibacterium dinghuense]